MLKKAWMISFAALIAFSLTACNDFDFEKNPLPVEGEAFTSDDWTDWTTTMAGGTNPITGNTTSLTGPFESSSGAANPVYDFSAGQVAITNRTSNWHAFALKLRGADSLDIPANAVEIRLRFQGIKIKDVNMNLRDSNGGAGFDKYDGANGAAVSFAECGWPSSVSDDGTEYVRFDISQVLTTEGQLATNKVVLQDYPVSLRYIITNVEVSIETPTAPPFWR
jgi:hypothetical protein